MPASAAALRSAPARPRRALVLVALRRRWRSSLTMVLGALLLAWGAVAALPQSWSAEAVLRAEPAEVMQALGNPSRAVPLDPEEPTRAAREEVLARANLARLVESTGLLPRWKASRAPLGRLRDWLASRLSAPLSDADQREALVDLLEQRLYIQSGGGMVRIGIVWPDGAAACDLVRGAQEGFLAMRAARESAVLEDAIEILRKHAEAARAEVDAAVDDLALLAPRRAGRPALESAEGPRAALLLAARREAVERLEEARRTRLAELQTRLAEERARFSEAHPSVRALEETLDALAADTPQLEALRGEERALVRAWRAAAPAPRAAPAETPSGAGSEHARERLRAAVARQDQLLSLLDAAHVELDLARAGFKYRYELVQPVRPPRHPSRTPALAALALAAVLGLAAAGFRAVSAELRAGPLFSSAWLAARFPLRSAALGLLFLMLAMPAPGDASNRFRPFWAPLGHLLNFNLNYTLPIPALRFTGADLLVAALLLLVLWRRLSGGPAPGDARVARPLLLSAAASLGALALLIALGLARGGDGQQVLWQCHQLAMLPLALLLFAAALRPADLPALGKVLLAAALAKAAQALWVRYGLGFDLDAVPTATAHGDSLLFTVAVCMLVALFAEERTRRSLLRCLVFVPLLLLAIRANNRRLAWVEVAAVAAAIFVLIPRTRFKRTALRAALVLLPLGALYLGAGWSSSARIFGPVAKIRSIVDSNSNRSTAERDVENYNLVRNVRERPLLGMGFGHEYTQYSAGDDISEIFPQWRFIPHNSVLGLLAMAGVAGFFGIWQLLTVGLFLAGRVHRSARAPIERAAALTAVGAVLAYLIQCYGDMGFVSWASVFLLAPALAVVGQLASSTGAWPGRAAPAVASAAGSI